MASLLLRLGAFSARHWKAVVVAWILALVAFGGGALALKGTFSGGFTLPATPASRVLDQMEEAFPDAHFGDGTATGIVQAPEGETVMATLRSRPSTISWTA